MVLALAEPLPTLAVAVAPSSRPDRAAEKPLSLPAMSSVVSFRFRSVLNAECSLAAVSVPE